MRSLGVPFKNFIGFTELKIQRKIKKNEGKFLCTWLGRKVFLKRYGLENKEEIEDFARNLKILAGIRHPNIVLMMGFAIEGNKYGYIVSEYEFIFDFEAIGELLIGL